MGKTTNIARFIVFIAFLFIGQTAAFSQVVGGGNGNGGITINGGGNGDDLMQLPGLNPGVCQKAEVYVQEVGKNLWVNTGKCCADEGKPGTLIHSPDSDNCSVPVSQSSQYDFMEGCSTAADCPPPFVTLGRCEEGQCVQQLFYIGDSPFAIPTNECASDDQCTHKEIRYIKVVSSGPMSSSTSQRALPTPDPSSDPDAPDSSTNPGSTPPATGPGGSVGFGSTTPTNNSVPVCVPVPNTTSSGTYDKCKHPSGWHTVLVGGVCQVEIGEGLPQCVLKDSNGVPLCKNGVLDKSEACEWPNGNPEYAYLDGENKVCGDDCQWDTASSALSCLEDPFWLVTSGGKKGYVLKAQDIPPDPFGGIPIPENHFHLNALGKGDFYHSYKGISPSNFMEDNLPDEDKNQILEVIGKKTNIAYATPTEYDPWVEIPKKKKTDPEVNPEQLLLYGSKMTDVAYNAAGLDAECATTGNCLVRLVIADKKLAYEKFTLDENGKVDILMKPNMRGNAATKIANCKGTGKVDKFGDCITLPFPKSLAFYGLASNGMEGLDHRFVLVGAAGTAAFSNNGIDWTQINNIGIPGNINDILYEPQSGRWVAVGDGGLISTTTSTDLTAPWTNATQSSPLNFYAVTYSPTGYCLGEQCNATSAGSPVYIAVGTNNTSTQAIYWSETGASWTKGTVSGVVKGNFKSVSCNNKVDGANKCRVITDKGYVGETKNGRDWKEFDKIAQENDTSPFDPHYVCDTPIAKDCPKSLSKLLEVKYFSCDQ
ncbi:MAG: hypothetical protein Q7S13_03960 [Candidatus Omnitrophota bacterium]|nr:hypothetical protein [Candidatus Omnitrophota bacterium]